jgi:hypothetical protein
MNINRYRGMNTSTGLSGLAGVRSSVRAQVFGPHASLPCAPVNTANSGISGGMKVSTK